MITMDHEIVKLEQGQKLGLERNRLVNSNVFVEAHCDNCK